MVCGYGDQIGYETLVKRIARASLDKSSRFTDWSRRPLSEKQLSYAAGDVTHLRHVYEALRDQLAASGRESWVSAEMSALNALSTYVVDPEDAWRRIKTRSAEPRFLGIVKSLARWRETEAQARDVPRGRILKDDAILEIAANKPKTRDQLLASRSLQREGRKAETCEAILTAVADGQANPVTAEASPPRRQVKPKPGAQALTDLLKVLLKARADELGVAQRLIASASELEDLALGLRDNVKALEGWRREAFGEEALRLIRGEIALSAGAAGVRIIDTPAEVTPRPFRNAPLRYRGSTKRERRAPCGALQAIAQSPRVKFVMRPARPRLGSGRSALWRPGRIPKIRQGPRRHYIECAIQAHNIRFRARRRSQSTYIRERGGQVLTIRCERPGFSAFRLFPRQPRQRQSRTRRQWLSRRRPSRRRASL